MKKFILFISLVVVQVVVGRCTEGWEDDTGKGCREDNKDQVDVGKTLWKKKGDPSYEVFCKNMCPFYRDYEELRFLDRKVFGYDSYCGDVTTVC